MTTRSLSTLSHPALTLNCVPERHYILVVDDDAELRGLIKETLETLHSTVVLQSDDGLDARMLLKACVFDLIIADIHMPNCDGFAFYEWIQANQAGLHGNFIFLTAAADEPDVAEKLAQMPDVSVIRKPFSLNRLLEQVPALLRSRTERPADAGGTL